MQFSIDGKSPVMFCSTGLPAQAANRLVWPRALFSSHSPGIGSGRGLARCDPYACSALCHGKHRANPRQSVVVERLSNYINEGVKVFSRPAD